MSTASIILSSTQNVATARHILTKRFPTPYRSVKDRLALTSLTMPYSFTNVNDTFRNVQGFSYTWVDGTTHEVVYAPGAITSWIWICT